MQLRFFRIPAADSGIFAEELNAFLRAHRVLTVQRDSLTLVLLALLWLSSPLLRAGTTEAESADFAMDLRDSTGTTEVESAVFAFDARSRGNEDSEGSGTFVLNTLGNAPTELEIQGPAVVAAGSQTSYRVLWHAGNSPLDVTPDARWRFLTGAPGNSGMVPPVFYAGETAVAATTTIVASYLGPNGTSLESAPFVITVTPRMSAALAAVRQSPANGVVNFNATVQGASGTAVVNWDLDGDGQFDDATGESVTRDYGTWTGTDKVKVEVTDAAGNRWIEERKVTLNKPPVANQPLPAKPAYDPGGFELLLPDAARSSFVFNAGGQNRRDSGLVVVAHGLYSAARAGWLRDMGIAIESRCTQEGIIPPDIALLDWSELAGDPSEVPWWMEAALRSMITTGLRTRNWVLAGTGAAGEVINFGFDLYGVREFGFITGQQLANWVYINSSLGESPQIDKDKPIHLIGHSAGGFVVGEAAKWLKHPRYGYDPVHIDRVTMLDTPLPAKTHLALGAENFPNPGVVERFISSFYGDMDMPNAWFTAEHSWYRKKYILKSWLPFDTLGIGDNGHGYGHEWYTGQTIWTGDPDAALENDGFALSPIINPGTRISKPVLMPKASPPVGGGPQPAPPDGLPDLVPGNWQTFGDATESGGTWTLTEQADAGMWTDWTLPVTAGTLAFEFRFTGAGDGDFLAVHFGDNPVLFHGLDQPLSRDAWLPVEIPLELLPVMAGKLMFTLVSRGAVNAQVQVRNIRVTQTEDPDADGLTVDQETAAGSEARNWDTDGDGLSDGDEVLAYLTDPLRADTDGDGASDFDELRAGTNPLQNGSVFRVAAIMREPDGGIIVRWPGVPGRTYSVYRSQELGTGNYQVLAAGIPAAESVTEFKDPSPPAGHGFYWVGVE